jgi:hypothetical protein
MILEPSPDDLPLVAQVLRPDKTDDTVDEKRVEGPRDAISPGFKSKLVNTMMGVR